jgi:predicted O-methyltransferase YrrM
MRRKLMRKRSSLLLIVVLGAALLHRNRHRTSLQRIRANVRNFDLPTAGMYDALVASVLGGLYERVADEVAASLPTGTVLEVGSGPGRLAMLLAQRAPGLEVVGVDISPEMVGRAAWRVEEAGFDERVRFEVGDVGALLLGGLLLHGQRARAAVASVCPEASAVPKPTPP